MEKLKCISCSYAVAKFSWWLQIHSDILRCRYNETETLLSIEIFHGVHNSWFYLKYLP